MASIGEIPEIPLPSEAAYNEARTRLDNLVKPVGSLGRLEDLAAWLAAAHGTVPPRELSDIRVVVFAGDHGVATSAVSAYPREVTAAMMRAFDAGKSGVNVLAAQVGAHVRALDIAVDADLTDLPAAVSAHKVRRGSGPIDTTDALTAHEAEQALAVGRAVADHEIDSGADLLIPGDMGIGNTTVAATLVAATLGVGAEEVVGAGTGVDDDGRTRKIRTVDAALRRTSGRHNDPLDVLAALGGACAAATAGFLLQTAVRGVPALLDGVYSGAAALVARELAPDAARWWLAGHRSTEPSQTYALKALGLTPLLDLGLRLGEGSGAVQAVPVLRNARAALADMGMLAELDLG